MNKKILILPIVLGSLLGSCGGSEDNNTTKGTINIGCVEMGYGTKWLSALVDGYEAKTGTKINLVTEAGQTGMGKLNTIVDSGDSTYDLIFNKRGNFEHDCITGKVSFSGGRTYDSMYVDITDVYNSVVDEGTNKTIKDKMMPNYSSYYSFNDHFYGLPWASGIVGIVRNKTLWDKSGFTDADIPLTTNQLFEFCDSKILGSDTIEASPFIYSSEDEYYTGWCNIFLAQYKGVTEFENTILEGKSPSGNVDQYFFTHNGMQETLDVMGKLLEPNHYQHPGSKQLKFTAMQSQFLSGAAFFCVNGSWLETEMGVKTAYNEVDYIKTPIISSITKRLSIGKPSHANYIADESERDQKLRQIIRWVDGGVIDPHVTDEDIAIVTEARKASFVESGLDHQAFIPCAAKNIDGAKDFLKFMYSDEGLNIYYETMNGGTLAAYPTSGKYNKDLTNSMTPFRKSIYKFMNEQQIVRMQSKAKFFRLCDLNHYYSNHGIQAINRLADGGENNTPSKILTENDEYLQSQWDTLKKKIN